MTTISRALRWLGWLAAGLLALGALAVLAGWAYLRAGLPATEGDTRLAGLEAPVVVVRDADGVPTIHAESLADAYAALGYVHAQDRLAQMELMRRMGQGRLAEAFGPEALDNDRLMRLLDLAGLAEESLEHLDEATRAALDAYARGVNAYLAHHRGARPWELLLARVEPEPWRAADSLLWSRLMAYRLSGNWRRELTFASAAARLDPARMASLWPGADPERYRPALAPLLGDPPATEAAAWPPGGEPRGASNAWALAGEHTASGAPLLVNDIHLRMGEPGPWYLTRIEAGELTLAGATAPGVPFLIAGHNGSVAWGLTNTHSDTQDLFIERLAPEEPHRYRTPDGTAEFEVREERIPVRGRESVPFQARASRHGPLISDVHPGAARLAGDDHALALAWTGLRADDRSADALAGLNRAATVGEALKALAHLHSPHLNLYLADASGIAHIAPGRVPVRRRGDGRHPVPGWTGGFAWEGTIPPEAMPRTVDPPSGRLVNANDDITPPAYPYLLSRDWESPHRARRIAALLDAPQAPYDLPGMTQMQLDTVSPKAAELLPRLLDTAARSEATCAARALLADWDGEMARDRPEPLIYMAWVDHLNEALLREHLAGVAVDLRRPHGERLVRLLTDDAELWCGDAGCEEVVERALDESLAALAPVYGDDPAEWRWGEAHYLTRAHEVLSRVPLLGRLDARRLPTDGSGTTLNRGDMPFAGPPERRYRHTHGATLRAAFDLADLELSRFSMPGGQSGHPLSPHYRQLTGIWRDGETRTLTPSPPGSGPTLILEP